MYFEFSSFSHFLCRLTRQPRRAPTQLITKFLSYFLLARSFGLGADAEPFHFHQTHSDALSPLNPFKPLLKGKEISTTHRIECRKKDFPLGSHEDGEEKSKWKLQIPRWYTACVGSYFHIYADILLNLFTAQRKFNFRNRYVSSVEQCTMVLWGRCGECGDEAERQRFWRVSLSFVLCTQNKFNIIRFIIITSWQHKVYLS